MKHDLAEILGIGSAHPLPTILPRFLEAKIAGLWLLSFEHATIETKGSHTKGALPPTPIPPHLISRDHTTWLPKIARIIFLQRSFRMQSVLYTGCV